MRLNPARMTYEELETYMIYDYDGNPITFCTIVDTDEGYALCNMHIPSKSGRDVPLASYDPNNPYDKTGTIHTYTLHSFVIKNTKTNEIVAKV